MMMAIMCSLVIISEAGGKSAKANAHFNALFSTLAETLRIIFLALKVLLCTGVMSGNTRVSSSI